MLELLVWTTLLAVYGSESFGVINDLVAQERSLERSQAVGGRTLYGIDFGRELLLLLK